MVGEKIDFDVGAHRQFLKREQVANILSKLKDDYAKVRENAARGLGAIDNPEAVPALVEALKDDAKEVRFAALRALADIGSKSAIDALISCLFDKNPEIRSESARFLGLVRAERACPKMLEALKDEDSVEVKEHMLEAIGRLRDENAISYLIPFLNDKESAIRWSATWAVGMIARETGSKKAVETLRKLERHADKRVAHEAATALRMIAPMEV